MSLDFLKNKVYKVDGIQITVGAVIVLVVIGYLVLRARR